MLDSANIKRIPKLRFPEFRDDWSANKIDEIMTRIADPVKVEKNRLYQEIGIRSHGKGLFYKEYVLGKTLGNKRVFWVKENVFVVNIVFAWEQAVAKTTSKEAGMIASHRFPMYTPIGGKTDVDFFLRYFLTRKGKSLLQLASPGGAGRNKTLGQKTFNDIKINLPSLPEQQKIAAFLSAVDEKIRLLARKKELLQQYKKSVMQKIFSREIRFKDDDGHSFPEWEEKRLGEVVKEHNSGIYKKKELYGTGHNIIGVSDLYSINAVDGQQFNKVPLTEEEYQNHALRQGDLLYGESSLVREGIGKTLYVTKNGAGTCFAWHTRRFRVRLDTINPAFLYYQLNAFEIRKRIISAATQTALTGITTTDYFDTHIFIPNLEEQKLIAYFLIQIDKKIEIIQSQLTQTQSFKKGLLQRMFV